MDIIKDDMLRIESDTLTLPDTGDVVGNQYLVLDTATGSLEWETPLMDVFAVTVDGGLLLQGKELSKEYFESIEQKILNLEKKEAQPMFTVTNILIFMLIVVVTVKFVIPRLTIKYIFRKFANLVYKPGKKKIAEAETEWEKAKAE